MENLRNRTNVTSCSECITITLTVPKDCRIDADGIADLAAQCLSSESIRQVCRGCPLQVSVRAERPPGRE
jgi:hypothetical protein